MTLPEPLTPPDCDLRGLPFMPLDVSRLADSDLVALSNGEEFKAAVILWCKAWLQVPAASLPDDDRVLAHLTGLGARWKKVRAMALHGWVKCSDGRLYHPVVAEKAREAWKHRQSQRERANRRWHGQGNATAPGNGNASAHATASPTAMQGTGRGTVVPLDKSNGAEPDSDKHFWDTSKAYLGPKCASLIGKWVRDHGKPETARAITASQIERAINPVEFIEGYFRNRGSASDVLIPP